MKECIVCGAELNHGNRKYCVECKKVIKKGRSLRWYRKNIKKLFVVPEDELKKAVWLNMPTIEIAKRYNVAESTINRLIQKLGLERPEYAHGGLPVNCKHYHYY